MFFSFCTKKRRFFGFCDSYGFGFSLFLAFGFRFSAKIQPDFRVWYPTRFSVLPVSFLVSGFLNRESVPREFSTGLQTRRVNSRTFFLPNPAVILCLNRDLFFCQSGLTLRLSVYKFKFSLYKNKFSLYINLRIALNQFS